MYPKLESIKSPPKPSSAAVKAAEATGATLVPFDPRRIRAFLQGRITLAELEGIPKQSQYEIAEVGYRFLSDGQLSLAQKVFRGLVALDPNDAYFHGVLGSIAHRRGAREDAARHYDRALEINPFAGSVLAGRGELRLAQGDLPGALEDLARCLELDAEGKQPCTQRARVILDAIIKQARGLPGTPARAPSSGRLSRAPSPEGRDSGRRGAPRRLGTPVARQAVPRVPR